MSTGRWGAPPPDAPPSRVPPTQIWKAGRQEEPYAFPVFLPSKFNPDTPCRRLACPLPSMPIVLTFRFLSCLSLAFLCCRVFAPFLTSLRYEPRNPAAHQNRITRKRRLPTFPR